MYPRWISRWNDAQLLCPLWLWWMLMRQQPSDNWFPQVNDSVAHVPTHFSPWDTAETAGHYQADLLPSDESWNWFLHNQCNLNTSQIGFCCLAPIQSYSIVDIYRSILLVVSSNTSAFICYYVHLRGNSLKTPLLNVHNMVGVHLSLR
jgi:hypothetical protein